MLKTMTVRTTIAAILTGLSMSAHAIADTARTINVPAGDLVVALESLAKQADIRTRLSGRAAPGNSHRRRERHVRAEGGRVPPAQGNTADHPH